MAAIDERINKEHRCNDKDRGKPKFREENLSNSHFVNHKTQKHCPGTELGSLR
jgi:hypothetical protein